MHSFHQADNPAVARSAGTAAACDTLDELYAAIAAYDGHGLAAAGHFTPGWPPSVGRPNPRGPLMVCAEYPEPFDAELGRPFTGAYGDVMREALGWFGVDPASLHVAYAVHWAPPPERSPDATQISASRPFLFREIELARPRAILAMGRGVMEALFMHRDPISPLLGMTLDWRRGDLRIPAYVTWHPAWPNRFKTQMGDFGEQIEGFLDRFGMPDGGPVLRRFGRAA